MNNTSAPESVSIAHYSLRQFVASQKAVLLATLWIPYNIQFLAIYPVGSRRSIIIMASLAQQFQLEAASLSLRHCVICIIFLAKMLHIIIFLRTMQLCYVRLHPVMVKHHESVSVCFSKVMNDASLQITNMSSRPQCLCRKRQIICGLLFHCLCH